MLKIFITALGLAFILEGLPYFALPRGETRQTVPGPHAARPRGKRETMLQ